jgi:anthranilate/para-aminobenzoate synthase component I
VVQKILRRVRKGCHVVYVPGNHDEFARDFVDQHFGGIEVLEETSHTMLDGRRFWLVHGDYFDAVVKYAKWLAYLGDNLYELALRLNRHFNRVRRYMGLPYWSLSAYLKSKVKKALNFVTDFENAVRKTKEYILAGDCMQVVIGQRISRPYAESPLQLYKALRSLNPSPYMYFYDFGNLQIVGSSPEILVRQEKHEDRKIVTIRPLAGTRHRGATPEEDAQLAKELLADPKEIAEHVMLIDLARNDVGRIAKTGTVKVTDSMVIEKYSHVQHIVSSVEGELKDNMSNMDVLRATFPAGTLSGAPKIRAMEIIDEMEITKRGIYGGAAGYLSFSGDMDVAIVIRTGVIKDGMLHSQAGAGVVADSDPTSEWKETEAKARAVLAAADLAEASRGS